MTPGMLPTSLTRKAVRSVASANMENMMISLWPVVVTTKITFGSVASWSATGYRLPGETRSPVSATVR